MMQSAKDHWPVSTEQVPHKGINITVNGRNIASVFKGIFKDLKVLKDFMRSYKVCSW